MSETVQIGAAKRQRRPRRSTYYCKVEYRDRGKGYSEEMVPQEKPCSDAEITSLQETFKQFCKGKIKPFRIVRSGYNAAETLKAHSMEPYTDDNNILRTKVTERPLDLAYTLSAKIFYADDDGYDTDENGKPVEPWAHFTFHDGSQADVKIPKRLLPKE